MPRRAETAVPWAFGHVRISRDLGLGFQFLGLDFPDFGGNKQSWLDLCLLYCYQRLPLKPKTILGV